jgi:hypothetical protein
MNTPALVSVQNIGVILSTEHIWSSTGEFSKIISSLDDMNSNTISHSDPTVNLDVIVAEDRYRRADINDESHVCGSPPITGAPPNPHTFRTTDDEDLCRAS